MTLNFFDLLKPKDRVRMKDNTTIPYIVIVKYKRRALLEAVTQCFWYDECEIEGPWESNLEVFINEE